MCSPDLHQIPNKLLLLALAVLRVRYCFHWLNPFCLAKCYHRVSRKLPPLMLIPEQYSRILSTILSPG